MNLFGHHVSQSEPIAGAPIAGALKFATEMTSVVVRSGGSIDHQLHPPLFLVVLKDRKATLISSIDFPRSVFFHWEPSTNIWLMVSTPLKNMKVSWDDYSQYMEQ